MDIDTLTLVSNEGNKTLTFPISEGLSVDNPYVVESISGLGPTQMISEVRAEDASYEDREIVIIARIPPWHATKTVEQIRADVYALVSAYSGDGVRVELKRAGAAVAYSLGRIKNVEAVSFDRVPKIQITVQCSQPYWLASDETTVSVSGSSPLSITYDGEREAGIRLVMSLVGTHAGVGLTLYHSGGSLRISSILSTTAVITLWSDPTEFKCTLTQGGSSLSVLPWVALSNGRWPMLKPGSNTFTLSGTNWKWTSFSYRKKYFGV